MSGRKICVVTGTRAEYGLLYWLIKAIDDDSDLELQLIVTGMHLSPEFGLTSSEIEKAFKIDKKIEILLSGDTPVSISKSMGLAQISFGEALEELSPDMVVVLGDRYEIFAAASVAMVAGLPIAHLHGGESTQGVIDEAIRHSITKMSHLHFTSTKAYRDRVIQLGEDPENVFYVGAMGIENIHRMELLPKDAFEKSIDFRLGKKNLLVTFHPVTLEKRSAKEQFTQLLKAIDTLSDTHIIFTKANSDADGRVINQMIEEYVLENGEKSVAFASLGQLRYLSALQFVDVVVGNSSSGLLEVPSFKKATINIGDRQRGRIQADSIINCEACSDDIVEALSRAYSGEFQTLLQQIKNPYDNGNPSEIIKDKLKQANLSHILKKSFFDWQ